MNAKQPSNFGEWVFLICGLVLVAGWLGYEKIATVNAWLATTQAAINTGIIAWFAANWGLVALVIAIIIAVVKWWKMQQSAVGSDDGPAVTYRRYKFVNVKLVR